MVEAFESELGIAAGETTDEFTLRTVECLGGCGWATIVAIDNRHRLHVQADDVPRIVAELRGVELEEERRWRRRRLRSSSPARTAAP